MKVYIGIRELDGSIDIGLFKYEESLKKFVKLEGIKNYKSIEDFQNNKQNCAVYIFDKFHSQWFYNNRNHVGMDRSVMFDAVL